LFVSAYGIQKQAIGLAATLILDRQSKNFIYISNSMFLVILHRGRKDYSTKVNIWRYITPILKMENNGWSLEEDTKKTAITKPKNRNSLHVST
jgi:hypothetical protein